ncbi:unnamed protein product, partial [Effrenium voratum]
GLRIQKIGNPNMERGRRYQRGGRRDGSPGSVSSGSSRGSRPDSLDRRLQDAEEILARIAEAEAVKVDSVVTMDLETSSAAQGSLSLPELSDSPQGSLSLPELSDSPQDTWSSWIWNLVSLTQKEQAPEKEAEAAEEPRKEEPAAAEEAR